ncbi:MAG: DNA-processing protein DprA [Gemmatimonadaceae bacterium]
MTPRSSPEERRERALIQARAAHARHVVPDHRESALLVAGESGYPTSLADLPDPPHYLFASGDVALLQRDAVAIVGTRRCTSYGERVARELATEFARARIAVISGMARGIDAAAHVAALNAGGATIAVLGTGVDVPYPAGHAHLHARIRAQGLILSERLPGEHAMPGCFPRRNRIIAALARLTFVVEAGVKSGALLTAGHALDLGRTVAAVPGPIDVSQSAGCNELLRDGAHVVASVADALALAGISKPARAPSPSLSGDERLVWDALASGPVDLDTLISRTRLPAQRCLIAVTALELGGNVRCELTGEIVRTGGRG